RVLVEGWSLAAAAEAAGVSERTAWKWVDRFRREGEAGLEDRSSAPCSVPSRTPADREQLILALRELRFTSPEIAETLGMPLSTVGAVLSRHGLGRLPAPRCGLLSPLGDPGGADPDRQRLLLPRDRARARLQDTRPPPPAHAPLPATHQRQSRTLHPHPHRRLGLRRRLPHQRRTHRRPRRLARLVQPTKTTPRTRPPTTTQPPRRDEQRCRDQHLGKRGHVDLALARPVELA